ncbi:hypothetical protein COOONC_05007 [Cooperia oncophora]
MYTPSQELPWLPDTDSGLLDYLNYWIIENSDYCSDDFVGHCEDSKEVTCLVLLSEHLITSDSLMMLRKSTECESEAQEETIMTTPVRKRRVSRNSSSPDSTQMSEQKMQLGIRDERKTSSDTEWIPPPPPSSPTGHRRGYHHWRSKPRLFSPLRALLVPRLIYEEESP